jgi:antitoxin CptB
MHAAPDPRALGRLRWRCRRGLLENDLLIERFFARHGTTLTAAQARGLERLMDLSDNDLLDLLLRRTEPGPALDRAEVREVLELLRPPPPALRVERAPDHHPNHSEERA